MYCKSNLHLPLTNIKPHPTELIYFRKICLTLTSRCTQLWHAGLPLSPNLLGPLPDVWDQFPIWKTDNLGGKGHKQGQNYSSLKKWDSCFDCETVSTTHDKKKFVLNPPWLKHIGWYYFISCLQFDEIRLLKNMLYEHFPLFVINWIQEYCKNWNFADDFKFVALYFWHEIYDEKSLKELQSTKSLKILQFLYQILILVRIPCCFISWDLSTRRMRWDQSNLKETFEERLFW